MGIFKKPENYKRHKRKTMEKALEEIRTTIEKAIFSDFVCTECLIWKPEIERWGKSPVCRDCAHKMMAMTEELNDDASHN